MSVVYIIGGVVLLFIILAILIYISNNLLKVTKYEIKNSKLPESFDGYKIVQISDVHSRIFGEDNSKVINLVKKINPDIVVMSGDIISAREEDIDGFINLYKEIYTKYTTYYAIGNHERKIRYNKYKYYIGRLKDLGVHVIINGTERIKKGDEHIDISALKFRENMQPKKLTKEKEQKYIKYMKNKLSDIEKNNFNILIAHDPENFDMYRSLNVDLILSGHVHGGLIRFGKICLLSPRRKFFPKYSYGKNTKGSTTIITSSGMGRATLNVRLFNRPEIVYIKLKKNNDLTNN